MKKGELSFSSFFSVLDEKEEPINNTEWIINNLQDILDQRFNDFEKRKIKKSSKRINFACPYCGDSHSDSHKKRGNIYLDSNIYKCFNCGKSRSVYGFFIDWKKNPKESGVYLETKPVKSEKQIYHHWLLNDIKGVPREEIMKRFGLSEVNKKMTWYLTKERCLVPDQRFAMDLSNGELWIFNMIKGTVIGAIKRSFKPNHNKYTIFSYKSLTGIEDNNIESVSSIYGLEGLDLNRDIIITEGPLDSFLLDNAISFSGIKTSDYYFGDAKWMYDNDQRGKAEALKLLEEGKWVFLWNKYLKDNLIEYCKDWTDVVKWFETNNLKVVNPLKWFSNHPLDAYEL